MTLAHSVGSSVLEHMYPRAVDTLATVVLLATYTVYVPPLHVADLKGDIKGSYTDTNKAVRRHVRNTHARTHTHHVLDVLGC